MKNEIVDIQNQVSDLYAHLKNIPTMDLLREYEKRRAIDAIQYAIDQLSQVKNFVSMVEE